MFAYDLLRWLSLDYWFIMHDFLEFSWILTCYDSWIFLIMHWRLNLNHFWARKLLLKSHFAPFNGIIKSLSELFGHFRSFEVIFVEKSNNRNSLWPRFGHFWPFSIIFWSSHALGTLRLRANCLHFYFRSDYACFEF